MENSKLNFNVLIKLHFFVKNKTTTKNAIIMKMLFVDITQIKVKIAE